MDTATDWPDRRTATPKALAIGDVVELGTTRYRVTDFHMTDEGALARLTPTGGSTFVMAHELRWDGSLWRPETAAEAGAAWGR